METKRWMIGAGALGAVALIGLGHWEGGGPETGVPETAVASREAAEPAKIPTLEEAVGALVAEVERPTMEAKVRGIEGIEGAFSASRGWPKSLSEGLRERTAGALIEAYNGAGAGPESDAFRRSVLSLLVGKVGGPRAHDFALDVLDGEEDPMRVEVAKALLRPGASASREVLVEVAELAGTDEVPDELKPAVLKRALGRKAEPELMALIEKDLSPAALKSCAVAIQDLGKPGLMGKVLERLDAKGLLGTPSRMPWFSGTLLAGYIRTAEAADLARALRVVQARPVLARQAFGALKERLAHTDPAVRRIVAGIIPGAVQHKGIEVEDGEKILESRLQEEQDPLVKGVLEDGLAQVRLAKTVPSTLQP